MLICLRRSWSLSVVAHPLRLRPEIVPVSVETEAGRESVTEMLSKGITVPCFFLPHEKGVCGWGWGGSTPAILFIFRVFSAFSKWPWAPSWLFPYQCMAMSWKIPKVLLSLKTKQNIPTKFKPNHLQHLQFYYISVFLPGIYLRKGSLGYEGVGFRKLNQTD